MELPSLEVEVMLSTSLIAASAFSIFFGYFFVNFVGRCAGIAGSYHYHRHIHLGGGFYLHAKDGRGAEDEKCKQTYRDTYRSFDCEIRQ